MLHCLCSIPVRATYTKIYGLWYGKPRVVYDGAAMVNGMSLNQIVQAGENPFNNLVEILIRFRWGRYACVADISKCFFQVGIPRC